MTSTTSPTPFAFIQAGTFTDLPNDCGVIAYTALASFSIGTPASYRMVADLLASEGIYDEKGSYIRGLCRLVRDTIAPGGRMVCQIKGTSLTAYLKRRKGWSGLVIVTRDEDTHHAVAVINGCPINAMGWEDADVAVTQRVA